MKSYREQNIRWRRTV